MSARINRTVLMSGADFFDDASAINPYMDATIPVDLNAARVEHARIKQALESAGITVIQVPPPKDCQDGIYTANWALVRGESAIMSRLPNARQQEEAYAARILREVGKKIITVPENLRFSGQGDALPCGNYLFTGSRYRSDQAVHQFLAEQLGYEVISLRTIPQRGEQGEAVVNVFSGWPDSFFYDIDLALAILRGPVGSQKGLIAWCPDAFTAVSQETLRAFTAVDKIEVSLEEAREALACNLVSTGETVVMSAHAPKLRAAIEARGLRVITPEIKELTKGGGYIRCTTLTLVTET